MASRMKKMIDKRCSTTHRQSKIRPDCWSRAAAVAAPLAVASVRQFGKGPSGTFARPPPELGIRLNDFCMPRKMEFKGWVTDYKQCSYQGLTETEVSDFIKDQRVPDPFIKYVDWEQTKTEQGAWLKKNWSICGSAMRPIYRRW